MKMRYDGRLLAYSVWKFSAAVRLLARNAMACALPELFTVAGPLRVSTGFRYRRG